MYMEILCRKDEGIKGRGYGGRLFFPPSFKKRKKEELAYTIIITLYYTLTRYIKYIIMRVISCFSLRKKRIKYFYYLQMLCTPQHLSKAGGVTSDGCCDSFLSLKLDRKSVV